VPSKALSVVGRTPLLKSTPRNVPFLTSELSTAPFRICLPATLFLGRLIAA
jgi:hypothetical protein